MKLPRLARSIAACFAALLASACVSGTFSMRSAGNETLAADRQQAMERSDVPAPAAPSGDALTTQDVPSIATFDPWERMNRFTYRFNTRIDEAVLLPVADQYRRLPRPARSGIHHFFANLGEVVSIANYAAQLRLISGARSLGRFAINSTAGVGGLFDVASHMGLSGAPTGFSSTLARWGLHPGPYLVIPVFGPSTLRDGAGLLADFGTTRAINLAGLYRGNGPWLLRPLEAIDARAANGFRYYSGGSPFDYDNVRFLYVRKTLIEDEAARLWHRQPRSDPNQPAGK